LTVGSQSGRRPLVLASSRADTQALEEIAQGLRPRLDYLCVAERLGAGVLDTSASSGLSKWRRRLEGVLASDLTQAAKAWQGRSTAAAWFSASEKVGLPLALRGRGGPPHVLMAHNLITKKKRVLHRLTRVLDRFDAVLCLSQTQACFLRDEIGLPPARVHHVWDNVDEQFFCPPISETTHGDYLLAVGRENRDYETLVQAARLLDLPLIIVASSLWSSHGMSLGGGDLPSCVTVRSEFVSYPDLRALYAGARLVVVPLRPSPYAAGVNGVLEAMAMGRASVITQSPGLAEYVQDGVFNLVVPPGDPDALADAVTRLWNNAPLRQSLGQAARARVQAELGMDAYAERVSQIVRSLMPGPFVV
jgi:glycosyltransferase involved in cell wall biosynthesis